MAEANVAVKTLDKKELLRLYREMVLIRRLEEEAAHLYQQGKIGGFLHLYIGQEAVASGPRHARPLCALGARPAGRIFRRAFWDKPRKFSWSTIIWDARRNSWKFILITLPHRDLCAG